MQAICGETHPQFQFCKIVLIFFPFCKNLNFASLFHCIFKENRQLHQSINSSSLKCHSQIVKRRQHSSSPRPMQMLQHDFQRKCKSVSGIAEEHQAHQLMRKLKRKSAAMSTHSVFVLPKVWWLLLVRAWDALQLEALVPPPSTQQPVSMKRVTLGNAGAALKLSRDMDL